MFKPIFDIADQCGTPNPLLTLSKNFGGGAQTNSSTAAGPLQQLATLGATQGDLVRLSKD
jgi:hypothetical protein